MTQATVSKRTRSYGIVCPLCHRRLEVGKVDLGDSAGQEELQRALSKRDFIKLETNEFIKLETESELKQSSYTQGEHYGQNHRN